jgi:hypothetical protein
VPKVQHKPIKRLKLGFKRKEQKKPKKTLVWRTGLSGVPLDSVRCTRVDQLQTLHLRVSPGALRYNSPDCPVRQAEQWLSAQRSTAQCPDRATVHDRSQSRRQRRTEHWIVAVRCGTGLSGAPRCQSSNDRNRQNPNGWVTWLAYRTMSGGALDCPVRPSTAALPNGCFGGWGYKYPPTTTIQDI